MPIDDLGPLPKADDLITGEQESRAALRSALDHRRFRLRDEPESDAGVDASLEILVDGSYTNCRSQLQLKSTADESRNVDGSVSYPIDVKNLNYLLNGTSPIYVLYIRPRGELRFVWAVDERRRLDDENPDWMDQKTITVRFHRLLGEAIDEIHGRVLQEGLLLSDIARRLADRTVSETHTLHIDAATLKTIDAEHAEDVLLANGLSIVTAGYPDYVLRVLGMVPREHALSGRLSLVRAYAEFALGRVTSASAALQDAAVQSDDLASEDRRFLAQLQDACDFQSGLITVDEFAGRERELAEQDLSDPVHRLFVLREQALRDTDMTVRTNRMAEAAQIGGEILERSDVSPAVKLTVKLHILHLEAPMEMSQALASATKIAMQRAFGFSIDEIEIERAATQFGDAAFRFDNEGEALIAEAAAIGHPLLFGSSGIRVGR